LYGKKEHLEAMSPWMGGGDMIRSVSLESSEWNDVPYKFEAGTPNIAGVIGMGAAMDFLMDQDWEALQAHEKTLFELLIEDLKGLPFVEVYGVQEWPTHRAAVSFNVKGVHAHDTAAILGEQGVCVRAGHHCAMPLHEWLKTPASVRASFGVYNTKEDVHALIVGLKHVNKLFN
jgi:cysteine desulfurase / selenocysteine lyase